MSDTEEIGSLIARLWPEPPRAAGFIVTIYGDVVDPRGGVLWVGNLIEICQNVGISESLVRTAVSRLVAADQLIGERDGRRSFYRLTDKARIEYLAASKLLFAPEPRPEAWLIAPDARTEDEERLRQLGFRSIGGVLIGPDRGIADQIPGPVFRADLARGVNDLPAFAEKNWGLSAIQASYQTFCDRYSPLSAALLEGPVIGGEEALALRLMLVHDFRAVLLRDPRLPQNALPADWMGRQARELFADFYKGLTPACDRHVSMCLANADGFLPGETDVSNRRLTTISG